MYASTAFVVGPRSHRCATLVRQVAVTVANTWVFVLSRMPSLSSASPLSAV
ncbi:hypothetical protein MN608_09276 [Microdochium nivale]|nr:hypothetical protein MN608_09276 [Microdochium nivale]